MTFFLGCQHLRLTLPPNARYALIQLIQPLDIQIQNNFAEIKSLSTIRDTLLPKFLSGEIQIKEAEQAVEAVA
jgi:type I restriction enzyme S subunit